MDKGTSIYNYSNTRRVWLDPSKKTIIAAAKTRADIRELIAQDIIQYRGTVRGKPTKLLNVNQPQHHPLQRIKKEYSLKQASEAVSLESL